MRESWSGYKKGISVCSLFLLLSFSTMFTKSFEHSKAFITLVNFIKNKERVLHKVNIKKDKFLKLKNGCSCWCWWCDYNVRAAALNSEEGLITICSKLDEAVVNISEIDQCSNCCQTIDSGLDLVISKLDDLDIDVKCCDTIISKLDLISSKLDNFSVDDLCCQTVSSKLDTINASLGSSSDECCEILNSKVDTILKKICTINIEDSLAQIITSSTIIQEPGLYKLGDNIAGSIIIDSDSVTLDLNGFGLTGEICTSTGIIIKSYKKDITIKNGTINGFYDGIIVGPGASFVRINSVHVLDCCNNGICFEGGGNKSCDVKNCTFMHCKKGVEANFTIKSAFECCKSYNCFEVGFDLNSSQFISFEDCKALKIENCNNSNGSIGFRSTRGRGNLFIKCSTDGITSYTGDVAGFVIGDEETKIIDCIVDSTEAGVGNCAYGIKLTGTEFAFKDYIETATADHGKDIDSADWHPSGNYIAVAGGLLLRIYYFDETSKTLVEIINLNPNFRKINSVAWSPDGQYLAIGTDSDEHIDAVLVYRFDPRALNTSNILGFVDSLGFGLHLFVNSLSWHPNGKYLAIGGSHFVSSRTSTYVYEFNGVNFGVLPIDSNTNQVFHLSFSPDGRFLASTEPDWLRIYNFDVLSGLTEVKFVEKTNFLFEKIDWSPKLCFGSYFIAIIEKAIVGEQDYAASIYLFSPIQDINIGSEILSLIARSSFAAFQVGLQMPIKWSPNGNYIIVGNSVPNAVDLFRFNPLDPSVLFPLNGISSSFPGGEPLSCDWSPSGRHIVAAGNRDSNITTAIYPVCIPSVNNLFDGNEVCNTCCGFGYFGLSDESLFIRNLGYSNAINFSAGITNVYEGGFLGSPTELDNIALP